MQHLQKKQAEVVLNTHAIGHRTPRTVALKEVKRILFRIIIKSVDAASVPSAASVPRCLCTENQANPADHLVFRAPRAESCRLSVTALCPLLTNWSAGLWMGRGSQLRLSVTCWEDEPGVSSGTWQIQTLLWWRSAWTDICDVSRELTSACSAENRSQECKTNCTPVIHSQTTFGCTFVFFFLN